MINSLKGISTVVLRSPAPNRYPFCSKADILKTYLEIIPPHQIYQLRQNKQHRLQNALSQLEKTEQAQIVSSADVKTLFKEVKRRASMIPLPVLTRIAEFACRYQDGQHGIELKKTYSKIIRTVKWGAQKLPLEQMVELIYRLAKLNKKEYELMKEVQKVIIEDRIKLDYPFIRKILFSYTHLNQGSSVLYSHISKTLTIGQHELRPSELAEAAYMLSKVSENAKGGYGVFLIAQKHNEAAIPRMSFGQLVKTASFLLTQDLGSNKFQLKLEEALYNTYPSKDRIKMNDFISLLKSTSGYYFKFKEGALLSLLKTTTLRMASFATLQQFEDLVWSWGRLGKGDRQVWQCLQRQLVRLKNVLKPRQLAFAYYSLCSTEHATPKVLKSLQDKFLELPLEQINQHYLVKFLLGMHRKRFYDSESFITISKAISIKIQRLSNTQFVNFLKILNESDLDFQSRDKLEGVVTSIKTVTDKLQSKLYVLRLTQIAELLFLLVKFQIDDEALVQKCLLNLDNIIDIPKSVFIKTMFAFSIKEQYHKVIEFVPIIEELTNYGPIGYFFSPHDFPLLAYCLFNLQVHGQNVRLSNTLLGQTQEALQQINESILNDFVRKGHREALKLIEKYHSKDL